MRIQATCPTGQSQEFEINETFFSTTDDRGVITAGNKVFVRTSGYPLPELLGQPHNLIRHRDMPRCVFRLLWQTVKAGGSFAGYVKNQAKNGNHYWVFALITPLGKGFLSVRIKPTTDLMGKVERLYGTLLAQENAALAAGQSEGKAAQAAAESLAREIKALGFPHYEAFSHHALNAEIRSRDAQIARRGLRLFPEALADASPLGTTFQEAGRAYESIDALFASLVTFADLASGIQSHSGRVHHIAEGFRLEALNVHIAAHPLGAEGVAVGMVAQFLNSYAQGLAGNVGRLTEQIHTTATAVSAVASSLSFARIQIEMLLSFLAEASVAAQAGEGRQFIAMANDLRSAFLATIATARRAIAELCQVAPAVRGTHELVHKDVVQLQVAQISGLTEVARLQAAENLNAMFQHLRGQIEQARQELETLGAITGELIGLTMNAVPKMGAIQTAVDRLRAIAA